MQYLFYTLPRFFINYVNIILQKVQQTQKHTIFATS